MTDTTAGDIAVVGASLAGVNAARALRDAGFEGRVVVFGDEPHQPYDRPPLSKQVLHGAWHHDKARLPVHDHDAGIEWRLGTRIESFDAAQLTLTPSGGSPERFPGGVVIATGAAPRTLTDLPATGVHVLRGLDDSLALRAAFEARPARVVVVGGGFIGGEVAASARTAGLDVTMVELAPTPFARALGEAVGSALAELHRRHAVDVRAGVGVRAVRGGERAEAVELTDGTTLTADVVVLGLGVAPDVGWLEDSGLTLDDGVVCDATLRAAPFVVAAGDAARWPDTQGRLHRVEHWDNAVRQGRYAGPRLLAEHTGAPVEPYATVPWMWTDQYDVKVQLFGDTRDHDEVVFTAGGPSDERFVALYRRGDTLAAAVGVDRTRQAMRYRPLLARGASWDDALAHADEAQAAS